MVGERLASDGSGWKLAVALTFWVGGLALAAAVPVFEHVRRSRNGRDVEKLLIEDRRDLKVALNDTLDPLIAELSKVACAPSLDARRKELGSLIFATLNAASQLVEAPRARANYFRLERSQAGAQKLFCETSAGRAGEPRSIFQSGTTQGDGVIKMLNDTEGCVCRDTEQEQPLGWDTSKQRTYRSFIAVPCRAGNEVWGMLTVDSPEAYSLSDEDLPLLRVLGRIIAIAVVLTKNQ